MMKKEYTHDGVTVIWQPDLCIHSGVCFRSLPSVFKPRERPWIQPAGAATNVLIETVKQCPSGALSMKESVVKPAPEPPHPDHWHEVVVLTNGPLRIRHACQVQLPNGEIIEKPAGVSLCRCGGSAKKPFCDGSHKTNGFSD